MRGRLRCTIVGYGEEHDGLTGLISRHGLKDAVQLAGKMTQDELIDLYRSATVFRCPVKSRVMVMGWNTNVLLEAMAMELAVVSDECVRNTRGHSKRIKRAVSEGGRRAALAVAIGRLLDDPALRGVWA